jgi:hypothetical protein
MSIVTTVMGKLGIIGSQLPKIHEFKLNLIQIGALREYSGWGKAWFSPKVAEEFRRTHLANRVFNESMTRLPLAR